MYPFEMKEFGVALLKRYPFVKLFFTKGTEGAGAARNIGIEHAKGKYILFLDADDWLRNDALDKMLQEFINTERYVFTDYYLVEKGIITRQAIHDYNREYYQSRLVMHSVTALIPTAWVKDSGGFDPDLPGWEEFDFYIRLAIKGYCGICLHEPLFFYRADTGTRRKQSLAQAKKLNDGFHGKYGGTKMSPCCGQGGEAILDAKRAIGLIPREAPVLVELPNEVRLEFIGAFLGPVAFQVNGRTYYGAKDDINRFINCPREDVEKLVATRKWKVITPPNGAGQVHTEMQPIQEDARAMEVHMRQAGMAPVVDAPRRKRG